MISNPMARVLRDTLIPPSERFSATVVLRPTFPDTESLMCSGCWWKPLDIKLDAYAGIQLEGMERLIHIPAEQVNSDGGSRQIRHKDRVTVDSVVHVVLSARLMSVSTVWECLVRELE